MTHSAIEMTLDSTTDALITQMGRRLGTKARSKVIDRTLDLIRQDFHPSDVAAWFSEDRFVPTRRTTVRLSDENAKYAGTIAAMVEKGRPSVLMGLVYFAAIKLTREDLESAA